MNDRKMHNDEHSMAYKIQLQTTLPDEHGYNPSIDRLKQSIVAPKTKRFALSGAAGLGWMTISHQSTSRCHWNGASHWDNYTFLVAELLSSRNGW